MQKSRSQALLEKLQQKARERQNQSSTAGRQIFTEPIEQNNALTKRKPDKSSRQDLSPAKKSKLDKVSSPDFDSDHSEDCAKEKTKEKGAKKKKNKKSLSGS